MFGLYFQFAYWAAAHMGEMANVIALRGRCVPSLLSRVCADYAMFAKFVEPPTSASLTVRRLPCELSPLCRL